MKENEEEDSLGGTYQIRIVESFPVVEGSFLSVLVCLSLSRLSRDDAYDVVGVDVLREGASGGRAPIRLTFFISCCVTGRGTYSGRLTASHVACTTSQLEV